MTQYYLSYDFSKGHKLSNCILYYLNWYYRSDNMWEDIRKCIIADGYCGEYMSKWDMCRLVLGMIDEWNEYAAHKGLKLISISKLLIPDWKVKGWEKYDKEEPRLLCLIWEILGEWALGYNRKELPLKKPHFDKKNPLKPRDYKAGGTYTGANRRVNHYENWV